MPAVPSRHMSLYRTALARVILLATLAAVVSTMSPAPAAACDQQISYHCVGTDTSVTGFKSYCPTLGQMFTHSVDGEMFNEFYGDYINDGDFLIDFSKYNVLEQEGPEYLVAGGTMLNLKTGEEYLLSQWSTYPGEQPALNKAERDHVFNCRKIPTIPIPK